MKDRELLELAAKAAGTYYVESESWDENAGWNPLTNDGDALRLAVKLDILERAASIAQFEGINDPYAATRRAIVRAAAEIGKSIDNYYKTMAEAEEIGRSQS